MAIPIFPTPSVTTFTIERGYTWSPRKPIQRYAFAQSGSEQRASYADRRFIGYLLQILATDLGCSLLDDFIADDAGDGEISFFLKDPIRFNVTGIALGTSVASQTIFSLPVTGKHAGIYLIDNANAVLYDDAVSVAETVQTEARTVTAGASPTVGSVMTCDGDVYRRVAIEDGGGPEWVNVAPNVWRTALRVIEAVE